MPPSNIKAYVILVQHRASLRKDTDLITQPHSRSGQCPLIPVASSPLITGARLAFGVRTAQENCSSNSGCATRSTFSLAAIPVIRKPGYLN